MTDDTNGFSYAIENINVSAEGGVCRVTVSYGLPNPIAGQPAFRRSQVVKVTLDDTTTGALREAVQAAIASSPPPFITGASLTSAATTVAKPSAKPRSSTRPLTRVHLDARRDR
jgi:hypothetical protein